MYVLVCTRNIHFQDMAKVLYYNHVIKGNNQIGVFGDEVKQSCLGDLNLTKLMEKNKYIIICI